MVDASPTAQPSAPEIQALFDRIAPVYDELNQSLSLGLHRIWKGMAVQWSGAKPGDSCVDVCCGSGDLALMLARQVGPRGSVVGIDFSEQQLAVAHQRRWSSVYDAPITWCQGDALQLPCDDEQFDAATMGYGLRNLTDIPAGLKELYRVLKPGATVAVLDFHQPQAAWVQAFQQWYLEQVVVPRAQAKGLTHEYAYIAPSLDRFLSGAEQVDLAYAVGFNRAVHYPIAAGLMGVMVATR